jgi:ATP-dependent DNA ligase
VARPPAEGIGGRSAERSIASLQVRRQGEAVRLFTRRGYDWTGRYPAIAVTAMLLRARSLTLDGEHCGCSPSRRGVD